jgi:hypothetical protein
MGFRKASRPGISFLGLVLVTVILPLLLFAAFQYTGLLSKAAPAPEGNQAISLSTGSGIVTAPITMNQAQFTIEGWIYIPTISSPTSQSYTLFSQKEKNGNVYPSLDVWYTGSSTSAPNFTAEVAVSSSQKVLLQRGGVSTNAWHHIALVKSSSSVALYFDGKRAGSQALTGSLNFLQPTSLEIGARTSPPSITTGYGQFNGRIEEVRVSSVARYVVDGMPPASAFVSDGSTEGLYHLNLNLADSSGKNRTAVGSGFSYLASGAPILGSSAAVASVTGLVLNASTSQKIPLSFSITENDGTSARADEGFVFNLGQRVAGSSSIQQLGVLSFDATQNKWGIVMTAAANPGSYTLLLSQTCNPMSSICGQRYPVAIEFSWHPTIAVSTGATPTFTPTPTFAPVSTFTPTPTPASCVNKCGNKKCEEVTCAGVGCICAESSATCPSDCKTETPVPEGCYYQQVKCFRAPCDPVLICSSPTPTSRYWWRWRR